MELHSNIDHILKTHKGSNGVSLYDHLLAIFNKLLKEPNKKDILANFEKISHFLKHTNFTYKNPLPDTIVNNLEEPKSEFSEWIQQTLELLNKKYAKKIVNASLPDLIANSRLYEQVGIHFGQEEIYLLQNSLIRLINETQAHQLRFWGKILCSRRDYYVACGQISNEFADPVPQGVEQQGQGINSVTFWVTHSPYEEWIQLPVITAEQLLVARQIKKIFTGDLDAEVNSYPLFPGLEKHLLKAQLVRITFSTDVVPKGIYKPNDENAKIIEFEEEEFAFPSVEEIKSLETWVHLHPNILQAGRTSHIQPTPGPDESPEDAMAKLLETDPELERLVPISSDQIPAPEGEEPEPLWTIKEYGDQQVYNMVGREEGQTTQYNVISLKSVLWPGAQVLVKGKNWASIYIGYAFKKGSLPFQPVQPKDIIDDPEDQDEFPEPNPKNPLPKPLESDTDAPKINNNDEDLDE